MAADWLAAPPSADLQEFLVAIAAKLQQQLTFQMQKGGWPVTGSFGVATFMTPPESIDELMKQADGLMYGAKQKGKNRILHEIIQA